MRGVGALPAVPHPTTPGIQHLAVAALTPTSMSITGAMCFSWISLASTASTPSPRPRSSSSGTDSRKAMTWPLLVPTHRVGEVESGVSMKVEANLRLLGRDRDAPWRPHLTREPSSGMARRSGRQDSGGSSSSSGMSWLAWL